ncbi:LOW QUALITY PROTEIN: coiled-coil domain-containing protein 80-like [Pristis pectinata]|uniref:LOW QUALITY PROTEIN: coiled-coil domain-containing protein 80-like n=1 Tax=Pristis pectinata TaxID=685728 RepID=UPI00223D3B08|nr:LOW QUALITY PROTEIN: coiled-coil domain-containing protein 80-like [Pristis pectinata]
MGARDRPLTTCILLLSLLRTAAGDVSEHPVDHKNPPAPGADHGPLARHFGKARLLVISAPGPGDTSYRLMERQVDLHNRALRCELALRDLLVLVVFQGTRPAQGKLLRVSPEGKVQEERLRPEAVKQVTQRLSLEPSHFGMVLLRKSLQVYERFPYAVRMEAVLETVDQMPLRKVESLTRRAQKQKCKGSQAGRASGQVHASRNLANRTMSIRTMPNRSMINRTMSIGTMPNRSLVNRTRSIGTMPNRSLVNRTRSIGTMPNRSLVNRTTSIGTVPNRTVPRGSSSNTRLRPGFPNSRKPFRSSGRYPMRPGVLSPGGRTRGKQKALSWAQGSAGERKAKLPRSPANSRVSATSPVQETVEHLMGQIKQKVQQMMAANPRHPLQRKHNGSQVSRAGLPTDHSSGTPTVAPTPDFGLGSQLPDAVAPSSVAQQLNEGSPERSTALGSNPSTARSQDDQQATDFGPRGSHPPAFPVTHVTDHPPQTVRGPIPQSWWEAFKPTGGIAEISFPVLSEPTGEEGADQPFQPSVPQPPEIGHRGREAGIRPPSTDLSQTSPPSARAKAKKVKSEGRENSGKGGRGKGRKNRRNRKNKKQGSGGTKQAGSQQFLEHFLNKRRLLVITAPSKDSKLYIQQRDEYLEHVCQLALRRISVVIILGSPSNSTLTVEHYQTQTEQALDNPVTEPVSGDLITQLRKDFGMTFDEFFMVLVDYDMKVKQYFDVPIPIKVLVDYMDTFPSRLPEIQQEKKSGVTCLKREGRVNINKFLSRLQWKRRLLIISTPNEEEWMFQQQMSAVTGQECDLGIRHFALLKMMGSGEDASGLLELFPANGRSQVEREKLSSLVVNGLREHFQVSDEHFMMLLVGKDGTIISWYLSPMWSLATIYEQVDSMQLRQEEMRLQESLGIHCQGHEDSPHY